MNVLHVGATGLVGRLVLARLLDASAVARIVAPTRRALGSAHPKLHNPVIDFEALPEAAEWWAVDAVICTLGTTLADAGSRDAFRRVDHDYPLQVARLARRHGAGTFALNSALGANARSSIFYNRVKGEVERDLQTLGFSTLVIARPSLLMGERAALQQAPRRAESLSIQLFKWLNPIIPAPYRARPGADVAAALVHAVLHGPTGLHVLTGHALNPR